MRSNGSSLFDEYSNFSLQPHENKFETENTRHYQTIEPNIISKQYSIGETTS